MFHTSQSIITIDRQTHRLRYQVMAVLPAPLHDRRLQMQKTRALFRGGQNYYTVLKVTPHYLEEIRWWLYYLKDWNGRAIITPAADLMIQLLDKRMGVGMQWCDYTQGMWNKEDQSLHINALELLAAMFAVKSFTR